MKIVNKTLIAAVATLFGTAAMAQCTNSNGDAWGQYNNPSGMMNVTSGSAMGGSCGLDLEIMNQNGGQASRHFVQDGSPSAETRYRVAFCLDPNSLPMELTGSNRRAKIQQAQCSGGACDNSDIVQIKFESVVANQYRLDLFVRKDNGGTAAQNKSRHFVDIPDAPTRIEYDVDLTAGTFKLWINATSESDTPALDLTGLNTSVKWPQITRARLGSMDKSNNAGLGSHYYLDEFESRRQTFIGGVCATP
jgi:hypothetical protein